MYGIILASIGKMGSGKLVISRDDGATWARTVMANYPTALRSNGTNVVGSRPTADRKSVV